MSKCQSQYTINQKRLQNKERYYISIKGSLQQEDKTIINTYTSNEKPSKYVKQKLTDEGETDSSIKIIGDCIPHYQ